MREIISFGYRFAQLQPNGREPWHSGDGLRGGGTTNKTTNLGGVHITVNGYNAKNDNDLARMVAAKINDMLDKDSSVYK